MTTLKTAGFVIAGPNAIMAIGPTLEAAIAKFNDDIGDFQFTTEDGGIEYRAFTEDDLGRPQDGKHYALPATAALLAQVEDVGGAISWEVVDGVACTCDEAALPALTESTDRNWRVVSDGDMEIRVDFTHREKAVEYRLLFIEDHPWIGSPFQGAEFGLDAEDAWRRVSAWLDES